MKVEEKDWLHHISSVVCDTYVVCQAEKQLKVAFKYAETNFKKSQQAQHQLSANDAALSTYVVGRVNDNNDKEGWLRLTAVADHPTYD